MSDSTQIISEHYQKTYELTVQMWEQRNTTFVLLLTVNIQETQPLLVDVIAKFAGITEQARLNELRKSFPYNLIQTILMMIILYLMVILYHRTSFIRRCYAYLDAIEPELKSGLGLDPAAVAFTREGSFYHRYKSPYAGFVAATYIAMLGLLLISFLSVRIYTDFSGSNHLVGIVDLALSVPILLFFVAYAQSS
jgi:hypothetical protein